MSYQVGWKTCTQKLTRPMCVSNEKPRPAAGDECCACDEATYTVSTSTNYDGKAEKYRLVLNIDRAGICIAF